jgi:hypothetical protein
MKPFFVSETSVSIIMGQRHFLKCKTSSHMVNQDYAITVTVTVIAMHDLRILPPSMQVTLLQTLLQQFHHI